MVHFVSGFLALLLLFSSAAYATTWSPAKVAVADAQTSGSRTYFFNGGSIQELISAGVASAPDTYNSFTVGFDFSSPPTSITNVAALSDFAAVGYISPLTQSLVLRVFYQETTGDIRSVWWTNDTWQLDPTVIVTALPLGNSISAFEQSNTADQLAIVVQYRAPGGVLTQRASNTDTGNWGAAGAVTT